MGVSGECMWSASGEGGGGRGERRMYECITVWLYVVAQRGPRVEVLH